MIQGGWTAQAKLDFLMGVHQPNDVYKIALYTGNANLGPLTKTYTTSGEVKGKGYQAGGKILEGYRADMEGLSAFLSWEKNPTWPVSTIEAVGALIYNASKDNAAMMVISFNEPYKSTNGKFLLPLPECNCTHAIFRMV